MVCEARVILNSPFFILCEYCVWTRERESCNGPVRCSCSLSRPACESAEFGVHIDFTSIVQGNTIFSLTQD